MTAAHEHAVPAVDDGVLRVELPVGELVGLRDALDPVDDVHALEQEGVDARRVSDDAYDGLVVALGDVGLEAPVLDPADEVVELLCGCRVLDYCDHMGSRGGGADNSAR